MRELLPAMPRGGRVVLVASELADGLDMSDLQSVRDEQYHAPTVYVRTKQALRMIAVEAAEEGRGFAERGVVVAACHPGVVTSELLSNLGYSYGLHAPVTAAQTPLHLALGPEPTSGTFHADKRLVVPARDVYAKETDKSASGWEWRATGTTADKGEELKNEELASALQL